MPDIDRRHINEAAVWAATQLVETGVARVRLAPGDATQYRVLVTSPGSAYAADHTGQTVVVDERTYTVVVLNDFGAAYDWTGGPVDDSYVAEKWTRPDRSAGARACTGIAVAAFLTALSNALATTDPGRST